MRKFVTTLVLASFGPFTFAAGAVPGVQRFHLYTPELATAGQPKRNQFGAIAAAGYKVVVNVAAANSNPDAVRDEQQLVEAAGMEYYAIPIKWERPDVNQVVSAVKLLESLQGKPVLVHCYVNSRASLIAYLLRSAQPGASDVDEKATMIEVWKLNRGYEFENSPEWQFLAEDAKKLLGK